jgi:5'-nucleotidase
MTGLMAHILVTNDDGINARGLRILADAMRELGRTTIVAPLSERSAASQSLTLRQPVYWETITEGEHAVEGTPADAMIVAFTAMFKGPDKPDVVVSGINRGGNLGENVHYSGTIGAAKEAAVHATPGIAFSVVFRKLDIDYSPAAGFAKRLIPLVLKEGLPAGVVLNVNIPQEWNDGPIRITRQSPKVTRTLLQPGVDPRGRHYYWISEEKVAADVEPGTDHAAILEGAVSITPLRLDHTHTESLRHIAGWAKLLEG